MEEAHRFVTLAQTERFTLTELTSEPTPGTPSPFAQIRRVNAAGNEPLHRNRP